MLGSPTRRSYARRGAVLIVVLAMLVLFAVLGLSFVLYSEAQLSAARSQKLSVNQETEPNPQLAAEGYLGGLIYDVGDTGDDLMNPIRGHSLARSKYGYQAGTAGVLPFNASPLPQETVTFAGGPMDSRQIVRFTYDPAFGVFDPERVYGGAAVRTNPTAPLTGTYAGKNYAFTYPDRHDYYLAWQDPTTGRITLPSFHRPDLGNWTPGDPLNFETQGPAGKFRTLRPRVVDHPNFPAVPPNADGTYTGDVQNMRYTAGVQHNDSYWMDAGGPVLKWRGKQYKAMVAPLVLDLSSRVNLSVAGNTMNNTKTPVPAAQAPHGSTQGWGPWEVNPMRVGVSAADLFTHVGLRQNGAFNFDPYTQKQQTLRINGLRVPPQTSQYDPAGREPNAGDGPTLLPPAGGAFAYPTYSARFPADLTALGDVSYFHPSQFSTLIYPRGPREVGANAPAISRGMNEQVGIAARYSDPKGRLPVVGGSLVPSPDTAAAQRTRALVTFFNTTQQFATVRVPTATGTATLGPVDLARPLADYRYDTTQQHAPTNVYAGNTPQYVTARLTRQNLARDIYTRLAACVGVIDGTKVAYNPTTACLNLNLNLAVAGDQAVFALLQQYAQFSVNMVDQIDPDDISTMFVWNPIDATVADPVTDSRNHTATETVNRVLYGVEDPRLVLNEVYSRLANDRTDTGNRATKQAVRQYWIELHNPSPNEPKYYGTRAKEGAARLLYEQNVTQLPDWFKYLSQGWMLPYTGPTFNPYRIEIAAYKPQGGVAAYQTFLTPGRGVLDVAPAVTAVDPTAVITRINFNPVRRDPAFATTLTGDELNVVRPMRTATPNATPGKNEGYYVIGPRDAFPAGNIPHTVGVTDSAAPGLTNEALTVSVGANPPAEADITAETGKSSLVVLRRLANPYTPEQNDPTQAGYNPYITVDHLDFIPTRDQVRLNNNGPHAVPAASRDGASVGRAHPLAGATVAVPNVADQTGVTTPPHTFFTANSNLMNNAGVPAKGLLWLTHLDREPVNVLELMHTRGHEPAQMPTLFVPTDSNAAANAPLLSKLRTTGELPTLALDLLTVSPRVPSGAMGGREAGRLNLNTVNHSATLQALFDPQPGNAFTGVVDPNAVWATMSTAGKLARTPTGTPRATIHESTPTGADQPYFHSRSAVSPWSADPVNGYFLQGLLRATAPGLPGQCPVLNMPEQNLGRHTYTLLEPARKVWNSTSHTSDSFLVMMTVGFFEVTPTNPAVPISISNPPRFGAELYDKVPGDLRAQFGGVIDRSCLTVTDPTVSVTQPGAAVPFQTKLTTDVGAGGTLVEIEAVGTLPVGFTSPPPVANPTCYVFSGGKTWVITTGSRLWVGYGLPSAGGDGEWLTVLSVAAGSQPGTYQLTLSGPADTPTGVLPTRFHGGGSLVSDAVYGHAGPQPGVTLKQHAARGLVPFFTRMEP